MTRHLTGRELVVASDLDPVAVEYLKGAFREDAVGRSRVLRVPARAAAARRSSSAGGSTRSSACNVLEHIEDDRATLADMFAVLRRAGASILLVPALARLYGTLDEHLRHFRRYEKAELEEKLAAAGFRSRTAAS